MALRDVNITWLSPARGPKVLIVPFGHHLVQGVILFVKLFDEVLECLRRPEQRQGG